MVKLTAFSVENYRRFVNRTSVKLNGPLIALVGPNEAGKSSALRALARLNDSSDFGTDELPRRREGVPRLEWLFELEPEDRDALSILPEAAEVTRVSLERSGADGVRHWTFHPHAIRRDTTRRKRVEEVLRGHERELRDLATDDEVGLHLSDLSGTLDAFEEEPETFSDADLQVMGRLLAGLKHQVDPANIGDDSDAALLGIINGAVGDLEGLIEEESAESPSTRAREILAERVPRVVMFGDEDRQLASSYDLAQVAHDPPAALYHLAKLANLDLVALLGEAESGSLADVGTRRNAANKLLIDIFDKAWNQQGIAIQFEVQGTVLHIQATTPEDSGLSSIDERSDGLRWFAALLAYATGWGDRPILLVDEIETHLHYDAQADLIDVLSQQTFTSKVIYTTHSFGCLPPDLGTGVRVVEQIDGATSKFENGFWKRGAGFSPLLAAMGAAAVSLTPTRHAVLAEGPSEAILLPSLLRQALGLDALRYQIAPGLASVAALAVDGLDAEAGRVAFLVDGDEGGLAIRDKLVRGGIDEGRIVVLVDDDTGAPLEVEDLVHPDEYLKAVNDELRLWQGATLEMGRSDLADNFVTKSVAAWTGSNGFSAPDKAAVAQRLADSSVDRPIFHDGRRRAIQRVDSALRGVLRLTNP